MAKIALFLSDNLMAIALNFIFFIFGVLITHVYDKKSSKKQNALFEEQSATLNKLPDKILKAISDDKRKKLSVLELNELIKEKTIDEWDEDARPYYKACPKCGSENLEDRSEAIVDGDRDGTYLAGHMDFVNCKNCGWVKNLSTGEEYSGPDF